MPDIFAWGGWLVAAFALWMARHDRAEKEKYCDLWLKAIGIRDEGGSRE